MASSKATWWGLAVALGLWDSPACGRAMPREGWDAQWATCPQRLATPRVGAAPTPLGAGLVLSGLYDCRPRG